MPFDSIPENLKDKRVEEVDNFWAGLFSDMYNELLVTVVAINFYDSRKYFTIRKDKEEIYVSGIRKTI